MCGRFYVSEAELDDFAALVEGIEKDLLKPRPNPDGTVDRVPGDLVPAIVGTGFSERAHTATAGLGFWQPHLSTAGVRLLTWGFPGPSGKGLVINARAETVMDKPLFRLPFQGHRCLVPANGFYEWRDPEPELEAPQDEGPRQLSFADLSMPAVTASVRPPRGGPAKSGKRIRYRFLSSDGQPLALGGIFWTFSLDAVTRKTCLTILTVAANADVAPIHERMPLLLPRDTFSDWLSPGVSHRVRSLLQPAPSETLRCELSPSPSERR